MEKYRLHLFIILSLIYNQGYGQYRISRDSVKQLLNFGPYFTLYEDNYFTTGIPLNQPVTSKNSDVKFQISFKHRLTSMVFPFDSYLFLTYTQRSFWNIYKLSKLFAETNYNPGIGLAKPIFRHNKLAVVIALKLEHKSNGRDSIYSRSINSVILEYMAGLSGYKRLKLRFWYPFSYHENSNLINYTGYGEAGFI